MGGVAVATRQALDPSASLGDARRGRDMGEEARAPIAQLGFGRRNRNPVAAAQLAVPTPSRSSVRR